MRMCSGVGMCRYGARVRVKGGRLLVHEAGRRQSKSDTSSHADLAMKKKNALRRYRRQKSETTPRTQKSSMA